MENFLFAFNTVLPFLLYIAFGYGVRMSGLADEDFMKRLNKVIFQAFFPIQSGRPPLITRFIIYPIQEIDKKNSSAPAS